MATWSERKSLQLRSSARPTSSTTAAPTATWTAQTQGPGRLRRGGGGGGGALPSGAAKRGPIQLGVAAGRCLRREQRERAPPARPRPGRSAVGEREQPIERGRERVVVPRRDQQPRPAVYPD